MSNKILVKQSGPSVFQQVGAPQGRPSFMDMARTAFASPRNKRITGNTRALGLIGMAGKGAAALATAQQTAERMQAGDVSAPLQAGITYQGIDPTGTINPKIGEDLARRTPAPAPTPNNQAPKVGVKAPDYSNMPPMHRPVEGVPVPDNTGGGRYNTNVAVTAPTPAAPAPTPAAPAPTPAAPAPTPAAPASVPPTDLAQTQLPFTHQGTPLTGGITGYMNSQVQQPVQQPVPPQQVPPQQQPQQVAVQQRQQVARPGHTLTQEQMRMNGVTGPPASTVNRLPAGSAPPGKAGSNFRGNPFDWPQQQAPALQQQSQYSVPYSQQLLSNSPMPRGQAEKLLGGRKPQGYASAAGVTNPNDPNYAPTENTHEIVRDGKPNQFEPLTDWDIRNAFVGTLFDKLGPDMVYKMTPHEIGAVSALMYLKLS